MSETIAEKLSRVRLMVGGDPTWDLSPNDVLALGYVLDELDRLLAIEREYNRCRDRVAEIASRESEQHAEQRRDIDRLQVIVGRLPKTADGVPIYPGMSVFARLRNAVSEVEVPKVGCGGVYAQCYSTREAAEAAQAEAAIQKTEREAAEKARAT